MSTVPLDELIQLWRLEKITAEQAIGYLIQHVIQLKALLRQHGGRLADFRQDVESLATHNQLQLPPKSNACKKAQPA